ncbi:type II toxin-antitoxin system HicA family toxin [Candidatus Nitrosotalea sp. TS]|uniref:type II toxin-antitoxin system HicA family toxin n=1 Tax=Candidatus Nitrosotalea sp. TS TaxID=2341020 RepID=UPI002A4E296E|nr:type II toxin-antitoxin system HicA family toxin [Candidatus Nitrosotalea sp. TS]
MVKVLSRSGFQITRQKGSHIQLSHNDGRYVTVPRHDPIKEPTLKSILEQAKITKEEFFKQL